MSAADCETVVRCYAFVARLHLANCDHRYRDGARPALDLSPDCGTEARRAMARVLFRALKLCDARTPLLDVARDYERALRRMWRASSGSPGFAAAQEAHRAAAARLFDADAEAAS